MGLLAVRNFRERAAKRPGWPVTCPPLDVKRWLLLEYGVGTAIPAPRAGEPNRKCKELAFPHDNYNND